MRSLYTSAVQVLAEVRSRFMHPVFILLPLALALVAALVIHRVLRRRGLDRWLGSYLARARHYRPPDPEEEVHVLLCIMDHFEPHYGQPSNEVATTTTSAPAKCTTSPAPPRPASKAPSPMRSTRRYYLDPRSSDRNSLSCCCLRSRGGE